jgi:hypothetical protein
MKKRQSKDAKRENAAMKSELIGLRGRLDEWLTYLVSRHIDTDIMATLFIAHIVNFCPILYSQCPRLHAPGTLSVEAAKEMISALVAPPA